MLRGAEKRERRAYELAMFGAWQAARLAPERTEKLKPLAHYLRELGGAEKRQSTADLLAALEAHHASGAPMKIRKLH